MFRLRVVPCTEAWAAMPGDERRRYCSKCERHVYDLSGGTEARAREIVARGACVRFRADASGAVQFVRSACLAAITMAACTPTGVDAVDDPLAVEPVAPPADVGFVPAPPPPPGIPGTAEIGPCEDVGYVMGGAMGIDVGEPPLGDAPIYPTVSDVPISRATRVAAPPRLRHLEHRSAQAKARRSEARAKRRAARREAKERRQLARAVARADRRAARAIRRFARAEKIVAKIEARRLRRRLAKR
jgi:hypothetical protein